MKPLGAILAGGLTLIIVLVIGVFSFLPSQTTEAAPGQPTASEAPVIIPPPQPAIDPGQLEAAVSRREAVYQQQITQLQQTLQQRQTTYQNQIQTLSAQVAEAQAQLDGLKAQEPALQTQATELENIRNQRLGQYQSQLQQAQAQYAPRFVEMQTMIDNLQIQLAQTYSQLGQ
jgi:hypothetical protein